MMDLKEYKKISGREALDSLLNGERVYFESNQKFYYYKIVNNEVLSSRSPGYKSTVQLGTFLRESNTNWYVKKPFDVREEMFKRPDEWVGAFKDELGYWHKVGFLTSRMVVKETAILNKEETPLDYHEPCSPYEIDSCIPIEDVPKEELQ